MAWDTEGTRRRLKEAATAEFAEHGPDGTTMARIAERAINKERLYKYFGDKQLLFETVLTDELDKLAASVPPGPAGLEDIGEFAGRTFDYQAANPQLVRLLLWEGLSGQVADETSRTAHYQKKALAYRAAQRAGTLAGDLDADHLAFFIIGLAAGGSRHRRSRACSPAATTPTLTSTPGGARASSAPRNAWPGRGS